MTCESTVSQDISEIRIPPIEADGFAVKYVLSRRIILLKNSLDSWFFGW